MKKLFAFFLVLTTTASLFAQYDYDYDTDLNTDMVLEGAPGLRLDGVYVASMQDDYGSTTNNLQLYLRFFEDGTVVSAPSVEEPSQVMQWLFPGNNAPMGTGMFNYKEKTGKLKFSTTSSGGKINYKGVATTTGGLMMTISSKINRNQFQKVFEFVSEADVSAYSNYNTDVNSTTDYSIDGASPHSNGNSSKSYSNTGTTRTRTKVYVRDKK